MKILEYENVDIKGGFLYEKQKMNEETTIDAVYNRFYETGRVEAFACKWHEGMENRPHIFWDSDVAKWIEGASYILKKNKRLDLEEKIESIIDDIEENQWEDGYINSYYTVCEPEARFTNRDRHELYCAGHLFEAACAYYEVTGKDRFLKIMEKYADCIERIFMIEKTAAFTTPGHEEIEIALLKMYRTTKKSKYLDMAKFFIEERGKKEETEYIYGNHKYAQSHVEPKNQRTAEGHSVRACYLYAAMADLAAETNDEQLYNACKAIFNDIVEKKMYITGGLGSTRVGEAFTASYDLKNDKAYAETCASIAMMFFSLNMLKNENNAVYADIIEREIYNGMISGLSLDGKAFFYENPLEIDLENYTRFSSTESKEDYAITQRKEVFGCSCCPPNLNRVLASVGRYIYGYEKNTVYVNQFADSTADFDGMKITQKTAYPKNGEITIISENVKKLCIRIPSWCKKYEISEPYTIENGYAVIENPKTELKVNFIMTARLIQSNVKVTANSGKAAVIYGPFVCAAESVDNVCNLHSLYIDKKMEYKASYSEYFHGFELEVKGYKKLTPDSLYSDFDENFENYTLKMIPFACFANRGESNMLVWFNVI